jgi:uncharacterized membrane protein
MMDFFKNHKKPLIYALIIIAIFIVVFAIGFPLGFLTQDPDGLERVIIDFRGETWLENLESVWFPILSWIQNEYVAGILGIVITLIITIGAFKLLKFARSKKEKVNSLPE